MKRIVFFLIFLGALLARNSFAQMPSADLRYHDLTRAIDLAEGRISIPDTDEDYAAIGAAGWLDGIHAALITNGQAGYPMAVCPSVAAPRLTLAKLYVKYMDANPKSHQMPDAAVAILSQIQAFPCPKSGAASVGP
ncbi:MULTISPECIES: Rap1a/Tai family immunity protein [Rhodanobacter]|uniref:Rap1a/Tai family immunity protein n=1 Tax=Rhodanobacter TaxID=75309 RepID=UPI000A4E038E|nr:MULTISPECIES: Rap1a/Tai family immunity protein [Rhodanobacter]UJJ49550.1 hypothetical protein LRK52_09865 [Rhodanobacter denitrificans]UJJ58248.1 hypothetical protein LRK55_16570 [Rhodanobacter denitrificans]UJM92264.1 hypothetical protein LRK32_09780 [Rhodanobacter denitrificans]UJM95793.1 hypothetical protein LRK44_09785 [Rhodanobacter denitrificans]UJN21376.1 hypothetical protein LRK54_16855 [Rhodanobacter denitrificans]